MVRKKRRPARSVHKDHSELFMVIVVCVVALVGILVMLGKSGYLEMLDQFVRDDLADIRCDRNIPHF